MGVPTGPFSATPLRRIDSRTRSGSGSPSRSSAARPTTCSSNASGAPAASRIETTASETSGPMPSPLISVMVLFVMSLESLLSFRQNHQHLLDRSRRGLLDDEVRPSPPPAFPFARDSAEAQEEVSGDRLGLLARKRDAELLFEVVQAEGSFEEETPLAGGLEPRTFLFVVPARDRTQDLLDPIPDRDQAGRSAELVDDDRHVGPAPPHLAKQILRALGLGHQERRVDPLREPEVLLLRVGDREEILG